MMKSDLKKREKLGGKTPTSETNAQKRQDPRNSGPTPVVRGGSGAKAPPLAARPKQRWQTGCWLHQCVLKKHAGWVKNVVSMSRDATVGLVHVCHMTYQYLRYDAISCVP